jgi:formylmethanofuran dehydrogenase subunit E
MRIAIFCWFLLVVGSCARPQTQAEVQFWTNDTDFSKGRLGHIQSHTLDDLAKFHGHLCDGLVVGALGIRQAMDILYPDQPIDRTNLRIVSGPSPCLTDVAMYLTGGRYPYNTFYVDGSLEALFIVQRLDDGRAVSVSLRPGIKPPAIDSMGDLALAQQLSPCDLDQLRRLEDAFTEVLLGMDPEAAFRTVVLPEFEWHPLSDHDYRKSDVINKLKPRCK